MCMTMRGVKKPGSKTVSLATRGAFADNTELQNRFFQMLRMGDEGGHVCTEEKYRESGTY